MIAKPGKWGDVRVGMYVRDPGGTTWRVDHQRDGHFGVQNAQGERKILPPVPPSTPVTLMVPDDFEAARQVVAQLGGQEIAGYDHEGRSWVCPSPSPGDREYWSDHLARFHGLFADQRTPAHQLTWLHQEAAATTPHTHAVDSVAPGA